METLKHPACTVRRLGSATLSQLTFSEEGNPNLPSEKSHWYNLISHLSLNREGPWGTTDDLATSFLQLSLFSTALCDLENSRPLHFLMLSSHLFL